MATTRRHAPRRATPWSRAALAPGSGPLPPPPPRPRDASRHHSCRPPPPPAPPPAAPPGICPPRGSPWGPQGWAPARPPRGRLKRCLLTPTDSQGPEDKRKTASRARARPPQQPPRRARPRARPGEPQSPGPRAAARPPGGRRVERCYLRVLDSRIPGIGFETWTKSGRPGRSHEWKRAAPAAARPRGCAAARRARRAWVGRGARVSVRARRPGGARGAGLVVIRLDQIRLGRGPAPAPELWWHSKPSASTSTAVPQVLQGPGARPVCRCKCGAVRGG